jgi:hypothetical protein
MWLNAGVPTTQVAEWAGQSVAVLLSVYAACLVGQDKVARRNIEAASQIEKTRPPSQQRLSHHRAMLQRVT